MTDPLAAALREGERVRWTGRVTTMPRRERRLTVTDRRLILEEPDQPGGWVGFDIVELAEHGVLLVGGELLTLAARTPDGRVRYELRPVEPRTFDGIEWPPEARPLIEQQLRRSAEARAELRSQLRLVVAGTIAGLTLILVVLVAVLLLT